MMLRETDQLFYRSIKNTYGEATREQLMSRSLTGKATRMTRFLFWCHQSGGLLAKALAMILLIDIPVMIIFVPWVTIQLALNPSLKVWVPSIDPETGKQIHLAYDPFVYIKLKCVHYRMRFFADWLLNPKYLKSLMTVKSPE